MTTDKQPSKTKAPKAPKASALLTIPVPADTPMAMSHVVEAIIDAGMPADAYVSPADFKALVKSGAATTTARDAQGVHIVVLHCRVRMAKA